MPQSATQVDLSEALQRIKDMNLWGEEWADPRELGRAAWAELLNEALRGHRDQRLEAFLRSGGQDRKNGYYRRDLLTALGVIELRIPRTRTFSVQKVVARYARREPSLDRVILSGFVLGLSTRKVGPALQHILGEVVSASTVSRVAKILDDAVAGFHRRPLVNRYRALVFDGVVLSRKSGVGALRRPVLVALGITPEGRKQIIDFQLARSEGQDAWEGFLRDLYRRGLTGKNAEIIAVDGGKGLRAAIDIVYPRLPVQRCWAHKVRNITDQVRRGDRDAVKRHLARIYGAPSLALARRAARAFIVRWQRPYPRAVRCLTRDLEELLAFLRFPDPAWRRTTRTTNAIERRFREVRRRTRPMGTFSDRTSMERILFAVFTHENQKEGTPSLFLLTQNV